MSNWKKIVVLVVMTFIFSGCQFNYNFGNKGVKNQSQTNGVVKEDINVLIKQAFKDKYPDWEMNKVKVQVGKNLNDYASGGVSFEDEIGGGWWLAAKVAGKWKIVADGNGTVSCSDIEPYDFPSDMAPYCYDEESGEMIDRKTGAPEVDDEQAIKKALELYHDYPEDKILDFYIDDQTETLAKGSVTYQSEVGGWWLAVKEGGDWNILTTGTDIVDCDLIKPYFFPGYMITTCYDFREDRVVNRVSKQDLDDILDQIANYSGLQFEQKDDVEFDWMESAGKKTIKGRGMSIYETKGDNLSEVERYFEDYGFVMDQYNVASGTIVGLEGYARDTIVCQIHQAISGGAEAMLQGIGDLDIEVRCGTI